MSTSGQPKGVFLGSKRDLRDLILLLSPAQRNLITDAIKRKTEEDEARCSSDLTSLEITGLGGAVLVVSQDGVFLRGRDRVSYLITDPFTFLRAMYTQDFRWETKIGNLKRNPADYMVVERKPNSTTIHAWIQFFLDGGGFESNKGTSFDIFEVRALLDSVMPSIGRLLVAVKANDATVHVEYARFPDLRVLQFQRDWTSYGSVHRMLIEHFGQVMADAASIMTIDPD